MGSPMESKLTAEQHALIKKVLVAQTDGMAWRPDCSGEERPLPLFGYRQRHNRSSLAGEGGRSSCGARPESSVNAGLLPSAWTSILGC